MTNARRKVRGLDLAHIARAPVCGSVPTFALMAPAELSIDENYQRGLSERSVKLISKIVAGWDWSRFKPPIVVNVDGEWHVIDGQHTAIAAATHGAIEKIPVVVVDVREATKRANAFVGHNRDRLAVTPLQVFHAAVAAGDEEALTVVQVCERAKVRLLQAPPHDGRYAVGDTMALSTIKRLIDKRGAMAARQTLDVLVSARSAPLSADMIKAVAELMHGDAYRGMFDPDDLSSVIRGAERLDDETTQLAAARKLPRWRAFVIVIANMRTRRGSRTAA